LNKELGNYMAQREAEFDLIPPERRELLQELSDYLRKCRVTQKPARLIFVCTLNSRRSHMSQLWASAAAVRYRLDNIETFSGGTESTAFNPRAVSALERAGFKIEIGQPGHNPKYLVSFADDLPPYACFSKLYSDEVNPSA
jgi:arsenate reductase (thioredoxin)